MNFIEQVRIKQQKEAEQYKEICLKIWGCIPIDKERAKNTGIYKEAEMKLLNESIKPESNDK